MRLLDRHLLRELLIPLGFCLGGFLLFWISSDLLGSVDDFQKNHLRAADVAEYYLVRAPEFLTIVLPLALLLALLYALTNHARHNEITAIRAAGVSLWRLALPYFAVGLVGSGCLFYLSEFCAPESEARAERIMNRYKAGTEKSASREVLRGLGFTNAPAGRNWYMDAYHLTTGEMTGPQVNYTPPDGRRRLLCATHAIRTNDVWVFFGVTEFSDAPGQNPWREPLRATNVLAMPAFTETPEEIRSEINVASHMKERSTVGADIPLREILNYLRLHPKLPGTERHWLYTKLHGRLAAPWTCLVVVLIAIPFGAASGRRNVFFGVAGSVFICFAYFVMQQLGLALGVAGYMAPWLAAWLPNLLFSLAGIWLTARVR